MTSGVNGNDGDSKDREIRHDRPLYICLGAAVVSVYMAAIGLLVISPGSTTFERRTWFVCSIVFLGATIAGHFGFRHYRLMRKSHRPTRVIELSSSRAYELQRRAGNSSLGATQARVFTLSVVKPAILRKRLAEEYIPGKRELRQKALVEAELPERDWQGTPTAGSKVPFAVLVPPKGQLEDRLTIVDADGTTLSVYSYREYLELAASVLRILLHIAFQPDGDSLAQEVLNAEHTALCDIIQRGNFTTQQAGPRAGAKALEQLRKTQGASLRNGAALNLAIQLVKKLSTHYAIVAFAPVDDDGRIIVGYERTAVAGLAVAAKLPKPFAWLKGIVGFALAVRPVDLSISLGNAWTAQSYHLCVRCEDGLYLRWQNCHGLVDYLNGRYGEHDTGVDVPPPHYRFKKRLGQNYAHFYTRFFPEPGVIEKTNDTRLSLPRARFTFSEVPPGTVFRALAASIACLFLVWLVGFIISHQDTLSGGLGTDAPAFLLTFPALAAAWLGFHSPAPKLLEGTMSARFSLMLTGLLSIAASGLFMAYESGAIEAEPPGGASFLWIDQLSWVLVVAIAFGHAGMMVYVYCVRLWEFRHLCANLDLGDELAEHW